MVTGGSGPGLSILSGISGAARPTSVLLPTRTRRLPTPLGRKPGLSTVSTFARGRGAGAGMRWAGQRM